MQVQSVPIVDHSSVGAAPLDGCRIWNRQLKWIMLWLILSVLTLLHSVALVFYTQYNLLTTVGAQHVKRLIMRVTLSLLHSSLPLHGDC